MAVKSKDEIMKALQGKFADATDDDTLSLITDISDTVDDLNKKVADSGNWEEKYKENDKQWREKYRDAFFNPEAKKEIEKEEKPPEERKEKPLTYESLFKTELK